MAVGNERAHTASLSEYERFTVVGLAALSIAPVGMRRDVAEQVLSMGREPGLTYKIQLRARPNTAPRRAGRAADRCDRAARTPSHDGRRGLALDARAVAGLLGYLLTG